MVGPSELPRRVISVLVADFNRTQSQLMCSSLRRQPGLHVASCDAELSGCLRRIESAPVDIILMNDAARDLDHQYGLLRGLHAAHPRVGLILILNQYDRDLVVNALRYGARGLFCGADQPFKALCRCIHAVYEGQIWANSEQIQYVLDALATAPGMHVVNAKGEGVLTAREEQVVSLVAEGISNREVAEQMSIKENTVKKSLLRIYDKLGVSNRVELVLYALTHRDKYRSHVPSKPSMLDVQRFDSLLTKAAAAGALDSEGVGKTN
jgi:DNA-binding NarL/FixJ family response regulator